MHQELKGQSKTIGRTSSLSPSHRGPACLHGLLLVLLNWHCQISLILHSLLLFLDFFHPLLAFFLFLLVIFGHVSQLFYCFNGLLIERVSIYV
jgi:hypothetical protein